MIVTVAIDNVLKFLSVACHFSIVQYDRVRVAERFMQRVQVARQQRKQQARLGTWHAAVWQAMLDGHIAALDAIAAAYPSRYHVQTTGHLPESLLEHGRQLQWIVSFLEADGSIFLDKRIAHESDHAVLKFKWDQKKCPDVISLIREGLQRLGLPAPVPNIYHAGLGGMHSLQLTSAPHVCHFARLVWHSGTLLSRHGLMCDILHNPDLCSRVLAEHGADNIAHGMDYKAAQEEKRGWYNRLPEEYKRGKGWDR